MLFMYAWNYHSCFVPIFILPFSVTATPIRACKVSYKKRNGKKYLVSLQCHYWMGQQVKIKFANHRKLHVHALNVGSNLSYFFKALRFTDLISKRWNGKMNIKEDFLCETVNVHERINKSYVICDFFLAKEFDNNFITIHSIITKNSYVHILMLAC